MPYYTFILFGRLCVRCADTEHTEFRTVQRKELLAWLAYHVENTAHDRTNIAKLIWSEEREENLRLGSLSNAVYELRRQLRPLDYKENEKEQELFISTRSTLALNAGAVTTDVAGFLAALDDAERHSISREDQFQHRMRAIDLYTVPLLSDLADRNWVKTARSRLAKRYLYAVCHAAKHLAERGEWAEATRLVEHALELHPEHEDAHMNLVALHAWKGERETSQEVYRRLERILLAHGETPSSDLRKRRDELLQGGAIRVFLQMQPAASISTLLMADIEVTPSPEPADNSLPRMPQTYRGLLQAQAQEHHGHLVWSENGSMLVVFSLASNGLACAVECQKAIDRTPSQRNEDIGIRIGLHMGEVRFEEGQYRGRVLQDIARLTMAAHRGQILCSQAIAYLLSEGLPAGVELRDLGLYRLRGAPRDEHLFQVSTAGLTTLFPAPRAQLLRRGRLPRRLKTWFGRDREVEDINTLIAEGRPLISLVGPGGVGKTALSLEVARLQEGLFAGSVWFVPLAGINDPGVIPAAIRDAMELPGPHGPNPQAEVIHVLQRGPALLILDNVEHLVEPIAALIQEILARAETLTCLLTSRQPIGLSSERIYLLKPLPPPDPQASLKEIRTNEAVRLFEDRAGAVSTGRAGFHVDRHNYGAVSRLCTLLDGIPLAIEMAAARIDTHTPEQILRELEQSHFKVLKLPHRDVEPRHRTVEGVVAWSVSLLPQQHQRLFYSLSVFQGGWTEDAARQVCDEPEMDTMLNTFRYNSLVQQHIERVGEEAIRRYTLFEVVRQYAASCINPDDQVTLSREHANYFLEFARQSRIGMYGPEQQHWLRKVDADYNNLRAAWKWSMANDPHTGLAIAERLAQYWDIRDHWVEGYNALTSLLQADGNIPVLLRAQGWMAAGNLAKGLGQWNQARAHLEESLRLCKTLDVDDPKVKDDLEAKVYNNLGIIAQEEGDTDKALHYHEISLDIKARNGDLPGMAASHSNMGYALYMDERFEEARDHLEKALMILQDFRIAHLLANVKNNLGGVLRNQGDYPAARVALMESLQLRRDIANRQNIVYSLEEFAQLANAEGQPEQAAYLLSAASVLLVRTECVFSPAERQRHNQLDAALRKTLPPEAFDAAWFRGHEDSLDDIIANLLDPSEGE